MNIRYSLKRYAYIAFALIILMTSWESNRSMASVLPAEIPLESIRIRILAHSDSAVDQWFKRNLQESIVAQVSQWAGEMKQIGEAREMIQAHLPEIRQLTGEMLDNYNMGYHFDIELGQVAFPEKRFGNMIYPAGDYEALRITLGEGKGQNWWCVLFPPLCFVDIVAREPFFKKPDRSGQSASVENSGTQSVDPPEVSAKSAEVRFFVVDLANEVVSFVRDLFA